MTASTGRVLFILWSSCATVRRPCRSVRENLAAYRRQEDGEAQDARLWANSQSDLQRTLHVSVSVRESPTGVAERQRHGQG